MWMTLLATDNGVAGSLAKAPGSRPATWSVLVRQLLDQSATGPDDYKDKGQPTTLSPTSSGALHPKIGTIRGPLQLAQEADTDPKHLFQTESD
jgi:hypothetical protein